MTRSALLRRRLRESLWFRPTWWSLAAIGIALVAVSANRVFPDGSLPDVERETVQRLLGIIATSMLTVSTFALSVLVGAFASASSNATPRATRLVMANDSAQSAIAAFIASFIFAMIALIALGVGYYGSSGRFVLLVFTIVDVAYIIVALLRWIATLSQIGLLGHTVSVAEDAASRAMDAWRRAPGLGVATTERAPFAGTPVLAGETGYLQFVDVDELAAIVRDSGRRVHVVLRPGAFVGPGSTLAITDGDDPLAARLREAFVIGHERTDVQDPRYGLIVLCEIAQRALSPAVNDPGTAIVVATAITRVLVGSCDAAEKDAAPLDAPGLTIARVDPDDFIADTFDRIARDGASMLEIQVTVQKMLVIVARDAPAAVADAARRAGERLQVHAQAIDAKDERDAYDARVRELANAA